MISGLSDETPNSCVFHAGTKLLSSSDGDSVVTNGGRVLTVVGWGLDWSEARENAYNRLTRIGFENSYYRSDIGSQQLAVEGRPWFPKTTI